MAESAQRRAKTQAQLREKRLAAALRANLKKRKAQARSRSAAELQPGGSKARDAAGGR